MILEKLNWNKVNELMPVIIQDNSTMQVLMLGYMNKEALRISTETGKVTFYSRTKQRLWTKGENSGNYLDIVNVVPDCDNDTLLISVKPAGPCCHLNTCSCFGEHEALGLGILAKLESTICQRFRDRPDNSYISALFNDSVKRIAQKVGEESVEVALAAVSGNQDEIINEAADLIFHLMILLKACEVGLSDVLDILARRSMRTVKAELNE